MRIGIVTHPLAGNYGGILQNFALQHILKQLGHKPITFSPGNAYPLWKYYIKNLLCALRLIKHPIKHKPIKGRITPFRQNWEFVAKHVKVTSPKVMFTDDEVKNLSLSAMIVGSDQVWRPEWMNPQHSFLSFVNGNTTKRIAYAASFGDTKWRFTPEQTERYAELLKRFDTVSVREKDGIGLCRKYFGVEAKCTLDPTLLVEREVYEKLCHKIDKTKQQFISAYILDCDDEIRANLERFAAQKGMPLKIFSADSNCELTIEEWIASFRDASIVITDSFHGTVFSIIFQKEFFTIANLERGGSRFTSLLSQLDLSNRLFDSVKSIDFNIKPIDWDIVNQTLNRLKAESVSFLSDALAK